MVSVMRASVSKDWRVLFSHRYGMLLAELFIGGTSMEEQQNPLTYEIIKAAVAGEKWATEKIMAYYDDYMTELATVKERQPDGSVKSYVDEDLKQEIALKLLEEISNFPMKEAERIVGEETETKK